MTKSCPSCGGKGYTITKEATADNESEWTISKSYPKCGGSGEVEEPDAVVKFAMEEIKRMKVKPSEADDSYSEFWELVERARFEIKEGIEVEFNQGIVLASTVLTEYVVSRIQELEAELDRLVREEFTSAVEQYRMVGQIEVLRGLLEKKEVKKS